MNVRCSKLLVKSVLRQTTILYNTLNKEMQPKSDKLVDAFKKVNIFKMPSGNSN